MLPADPVVNTKLPVLLKYAPKPFVTAVYKSGARAAFSVPGNVAQAIAAAQDGGGMGSVPQGMNAPPGSVKILEVGFPSSILHSVEILDLPAGHWSVPGYGFDAAIWTTVATQAWRESERAQWMRLPQAVRSRSLLAVTFCDLVADRESNLKRLQARLETSAKSSFRSICFVANGDEEPAAAAASNRVLFVQVQYLAQEFSAERLGKAMTVARRVMGNAIKKLGPGTGLGQAGPTGDAMAEASRSLFDEDWVAALKQPLPQGGFQKPSILRGSQGSPQRSGAAAKKPRAPRAPAAGGDSGGRTQWLTVGAAALVGGAVAFAAVQSGLLGTGSRPVSSPQTGASEAVGQGAKAEAEARRKAAAEAAAAEARRKAAAEAAAAEASRKAAAEAAAAEARRKAAAEAAAAEVRRKAAAEAAAAEVRRKAAAEAAAAEARRKAAAEAAAAEARRKAAAEAAAAEARRKAEAEAAAEEARRQAEAEAAAAEIRRQAEAEAAAAEARKQAEARKKAKAAAEARRRKKAAVAASARKKAAAEEAERRRRAAMEAPVRRSGGGSPIMHGIGN